MCKISTWWSTSILDCSHTSGEFQPSLTLVEQIGNDVPEGFPGRWTCFIDGSPILHCLNFAESIPTIFHHGGGKPEVVFHDDSWCGRRVFSMDYICLRVAQPILAIGHTGDRFGRPLANFLSR